MSVETFLTWITDFLFIVLYLLDKKFSSYRHFIRITFIYNISNFPNYVTDTQDTEEINWIECTKSNKSIEIKCVWCHCACVWVRDEINPQDGRSNLRCDFVVIYNALLLSVSPYHLISCGDEMLPAGFRTDIAFRKQCVYHPLRSNSWHMNKTINTPNVLCECV